jgi:hypothetical protein
MCLSGQLIVTLLGPTIVAVCNISYSGLSVDECRAWADEIRTDYASEYQECSTESQILDSGSNPVLLFACLQAKGLGPGQ